MSDTAASTPAGTPPVDHRPRPQYGELAPEGWVWKPPADAQAPTSDASAVSTDSAPGTPVKPVKSLKPAKPAKPAKPTGASTNPKARKDSRTVPFKPIQSTAPPAAGQTVPNSSFVRPVPTWDRYVTILLLVVGLLATFTAVSSFSQAPTAMQQLYTAQELGTYEAPAYVSAILLSGSMLEGLIWAATTAFSVSLLVRGKRAFHLPIIGGVVSGVVLFAFMIVVLVTDPNVLSVYSRP